MKNIPNQPMISASFQSQLGNLNPALAHPSSRKSPSLLRILLLAGICLAALPSWAAEPVLKALPSNAPSLNETARYLAGLNPGGPGLAAQMAASPEWQAHAQALGAAWNRFGARRWQTIRAWSSRELAGAGDPQAAVFYPFSGPDFIYAYNYFPRANAYLLCGLEAVGSVPDLTKVDAASLASLRNSFETLLNAGYFVTKTMRLEMRGTLPMMLVMLARSGCTITRVERLKSGVEIRFIPENGQAERRLIYLATDLSNGGFGKGELPGIFNQLRPKSAYIKSASYLLHQNGFSSIRSFILSRCNLIVQDDSGIPLRYFSPQSWTLRLFGTYTPPLNLFKEYYQPDAAALYAQTPTKPLNFGVGYKWNPAEADLIVASAK